MKTTFNLPLELPEHKMTDVVEGALVFDPPLPPNGAAFMVFITGQESTNPGPSFVGGDRRLAVWTGDTGSQGYNQNFCSLWVDGNIVSKALPNGWIWLLGAVETPQE